MEPQTKVTEAMPDHARLIERSNDPNTVIAAATWEKRCIEELGRLEKAARRAEPKAAA